MKNEKGFTLTELLVVLFILALLMTLAFPNFSDLSNKAKSNYDMSTRVLIRSAARMYVNNNKDEVEEKIQNNGAYCLPIGKLISYEYLDSDIKNSNNEPISGEQAIRVTKSGKTYQYALNSDCEVPSDYRPPIITITGSGCKSVMSTTIENYNNCKIKVTDDKDDTNLSSDKEYLRYFIGLKQEVIEKENGVVIREDNENTRNKQRQIKFSKVVVQEDNKIFITYNAKDSSGNKSVPLHVQLILPE